MAATAREVAHRAGVSVSTVSRALSSPPQASAATVEVVSKVAEELGYRPNGAARSLVTGRTMSLGLIVPDLENPYFASVAKAVQGRAWSHGYTVLVADSDEDPATEQQLVRTLAPRVDGLVLCSPRHGMDREALSQLGPVVVVNRAVEGVGCVQIDNPAAARTAITHLRALGHRRIAYVGGPESSWSDRERREGLARCIEDFPDTEIVDLGHFGPFYSGGVAAADLTVASGVTAVVAFNDLMALGLLARLRERGISVPGDMSLVGIDNISTSAMVTPALTTVGVPQGQLGKAAVDRLLPAIRDGGVDRDPATVLQVHLVVRQSTAARP